MRRLHFAAERLNTSTLARSANRCLYALDFHFTLSDAHPVAARFQPIHDVRVYGHLRFKEVPLIGVIVASWLIAFVEYCVAVPANRWGSAVYTTAQLKTIQEVITLLVFGRLPEGAVDLELCDRLRTHCAGRVLRPARPAVVRFRDLVGHSAALSGGAEDEILPICHLAAMITKGRLPQP